MRQAKGEQVRHELLPGQSVELLKELHLISRDGALHADSLRKLKQVNHLVRLLEPALLDVLQRHPQPVLVDAGAGNAYLGFVLYELFLKNTSGILYSIEHDRELVVRGRVRAERLGFERMRFIEAPIGGEPLELPERVHLVMALHACDTATDDALLLALKRDADHIAAVPCCQAEVAAQLKARPGEGLLPLLWKHPIHRREMGAHLTNVIRALVLQSQGYQVTVTELTGWEHSLKNELILGRRVHREHRPSRRELDELLAATGVQPKLVRELFGAKTQAP